MLKDPYHCNFIAKYTQDTVSNINKYVNLEYDKIRENIGFKISDFKDNYVLLRPVFLFGFSDIEKEIPAFNHPLINIQNNWIALDLRNIVKIDKTKSMSYEVKNYNEFNLALIRFILSGMWVTSKELTLYESFIPHISFSNWLSDNLTRSLGLDIYDSVVLRIVFSVYYSLMFKKTLNEDDILKIILRIKRFIFAGDLIESVVKKMHSITDMINYSDIRKILENLSKITNNLRLEAVKLEYLLNLVSKNWVGFNSKELVFLSLEHPPTWISLVFSSITQKSFQNSFISNTVQRVIKSHRSLERQEDFINKIKHYISDYTDFDLKVI